MVDPFISQDSSSPRKSTLKPYVCVHCGHPCDEIFRRLGASLSSIKVMTCKRCGKVVDPYIEQEWLLVAIDCTLSRAEAYRHVLYNVDEFKECHIRTCAKALLGWGVLDAVLKLQTFADMHGATGEEGIQFSPIGWKEFVFLVVTSVGGLLFQWSILKMFLTAEERSSASSTKLFWCLILPRSFDIIVILVTIWENTNTVRMLGSLFCLYWQGMAIWTVCKDISAPTLTVGTSLLWNFLQSFFLGQSDPCTGLEYEISAGYTLCLS